MRMTRSFATWSALLSLACAVGSAQTSSGVANAPDTPGTAPSGSYFPTPRAFDNTPAPATVPTRATTPTRSVVPAASTVPKAAIVDAGIGLGLTLFSAYLNRHDNQPAADEAPTPSPEDLAAEQQQLFNSEATNILSETNSLMAADEVPSETPDAADSTSEVNSLLGGDTPAPDSTTAVTNLLGDAPDPNADTTTAVSNLLTPSGDAPGPASQNPCGLSASSSQADFQACANRLTKAANSAVPPLAPQPALSPRPPDVISFNGDGSSTVVTYPAEPTPPESITFNKDGSSLKVYSNGDTVTVNGDGSVTYKGHQPTVVNYDKTGSVAPPTSTTNSDGSVTFPKLPSAVPPKGNQ